MPFVLLFLLLLSTSTTSSPPVDYDKSGKLELKEFKSFIKNCDIHLTKKV